jgi:co-chaperonin GroES (HSP10)
MNLKPINQDVILQFVPEHEAKDSIIYYKDDPNEQKAQYFKVVAKSDEVDLVEVGDMVICKWTNMTPSFPYEIDGQEEQLGITSQSQLEAVISQ